MTVQPITQNPSINLPQQGKVIAPCKATLIALGIILMISSAPATGLLYSYLGYVSFSFLALAPLGVLLCSIQKFSQSSDNLQPATTTNSKKNLSIPKTISVSQLKQNLQVWTHLAERNDEFCTNIETCKDVADKIIHCHETKAKKLALFLSSKNEHVNPFSDWRWQKLTSLPEEIGFLTHLEELIIPNRCLLSLPSQIGQLKNLKTLDLGGNSFHFLPPEIGQLKKLQKLNLLGTSLYTLPTEFKALQNLKKLSISGAGFKQPPLEVFQLKNLKELLLGSFHNQSWLTDTWLPSIGLLTKLEKLELYNCKITSLTQEIGKLTKLKELHLQSNTLLSLTSEIMQLKKLKVLDLSVNALTVFPLEIIQACNCTLIRFNINRISSLPNEIMHLSQNLTIDLTANPLSSNVTANLQQRINAPGYAGPRIFFSIRDRRNGGPPPLEDCLQALSTAAKNDPLQLTQLTQDPKHAADLREWLWRLDDMGDYKTNRKELAQYIYQMVQKAETDPEYREAFLLSIDGAAETCGDRMALSLLYVDIQYQIGQSIKNQDWIRLAYLVNHGSWALNELEKIARNKVKTLHFVDEIEVYLAYPVKLKEALDLPIVNEDMLYFACSSVTEEDLQNAYDIVKPALSNKESYCKHLAEEQTWHKALVAIRPQQYQQIRAKRDKQKDPVKAAEAYLQELSALTEEVLNTIGWPLFLPG